MCKVISIRLSRFGWNDGWARINGCPYNNLLLGNGLCSSNQ